MGTRASETGSLRAIRDNDRVVTVSNLALSWTEVTTLSSAEAGSCLPEPWPNAGSHSQSHSQTAGAMVKLRIPALFSRIPTIFRFPAGIGPSGQNRSFPAWIRPFGPVSRIPEPLPGSPRRVPHPFRDLPPSHGQPGGNHGQTRRSHGQSSGQTSRAMVNLTEQWSIQPEPWSVCHAPRIMEETEFRVVARWCGKPHRKEWTNRSSPFPDRRRFPRLEERASERHFPSRSAAARRVSL